MSKVFEPGDRVEFTRAVGMAKPGYRGEIESRGLPRAGRGPKYVVRLPNAVRVDCFGEALKRVVPGPATNYPEGAIVQATMHFTTPYGAKYAPGDLMVVTRTPLLDVIGIERLGARASLERADHVSLERVRLIAKPFSGEPERGVRVIVGHRGHLYDGRPWLGLDGEPECEPGDLGTIEGEYRPVTNKVTVRWDKDGRTSALDPESVLQVVNEPLTYPVRIAAEEITSGKIMAHAVALPEPEDPESHKWLRRAEEYLDGSGMRYSVADVIALASFMYDVDED